MLALQLTFVTDALTLHEQGLLSVSEQAVDSLLCLVCQDDSRPVVTPFLPDLVGRLSQYILVAKNPEFFEIILEVFTSYKRKLLENPGCIGDLIQGMVQRVLVELENLRKTEKEESEKQIISKIWSVFIAIGEDKIFIPKYQAQVEEIMEPLFVLFANEKKVIFEDFMIIYATEVTKLSKQVSNHCWTTLKALPEIFARSKGIVASMFPLLNQFLIHGNQMISQDAESVQILVEIGVQGLNPTHPLTTETDSCQAALLLQLIIQYLGNISQQSWERIIVSCLDKLKSCEKGYLKTK